jgi:hypothetical protein
MRSRKSESGGFGSAFLRSRALFGGGGLSVFFLFGFPGVMGLLLNLRINRQAQSGLAWRSDCHELLEARFGGNGIFDDGGATGFRDM